LLKPAAFHNLDDGRIESDSNTLERSIRPIADQQEKRPVRGLRRRAEQWATISFADRTA
jgi:hypothetical protein